MRKFKSVEELINTLKPDYPVYCIRPDSIKKSVDFFKNKFPGTVLRSKGLFWIASRPDQAMVWSQAGGSLKADGAGVWWSSMTFRDRMQHLSFIQNQNQIESDWDKVYGDRKNELVFIGQEMDEKLIRRELDNCLATEGEILTQEWKYGFEDDWPIERMKPLKV